jgi:hypothetical protein
MKLLIDTGGSAAARLSTSLRTVQQDSLCGPRSPLSKEPRKPLSPSGLPQTPKKPEDGAGRTIGAATPQASPGPKRFHGSVELDPTRVGRDAGRVADEVIAHLAGLVGATVKVTLDIAAEIPSGAPDQVVRTVTENSRTLKFKSQGFEQQ